MRAEPRRISSERLIELLCMVRGCRTVTVYAETVPRLRQRSAAGVLCPWFVSTSTARDPVTRRWLVRKQATFSAAVVGKRRPGQGSAYESAVNRRRAREWRPLSADGTPEYFESSGRRWGKRRRGAPLVDYRGRVYLDVQRLRVLSFQFRDVRDGRTVTLSQLTPWLQSDGGPTARQGVRDGVVWRDYRIDRVRRVTMDGEMFDVAKPGRIRATRESCAEGIERRKRMRGSQG